MTFAWLIAKKVFLVCLISLHQIGSHTLQLAWMIAETQDPNILRGLVAKKAEESHA